MKNNRSTINKIYYGFLASGMIEVIFGALLLLFMQVYDLSYSEAGVLLSAKFLGNFLSFIVFMVLVGSIGRKWTIRLISSLIPLGILGLIILDKPGLFFVYSGIIGIGLGSINNMGNTLVSEITSGDPKYLNVLSGVFGIGAFVAPVMVSVALSRGLSLKAILTVFFVFIFVAVAGLFTIDGDQRSSTSSRRGFGFLQDSQFRISAMMIFFYTGAEFAIVGWLVTYLRDSGLMADHDSRQYGDCYYF